MNMRFSTPRIREPPAETAEESARWEALTEHHAIRPGVTMAPGSRSPYASGSGGAYLHAGAMTAAATGTPTSINGRGYWQRVQVTQSTDLYTSWQQNC